MARTIHCCGCGARMRLSTELLGKIEGRTGRITCKICGTRLRLDASSEELRVELEDTSARVSAAALLSRPTGERITPTAELDPPSVAPAAGSASASSTAAGSLGVSLPPPLPRSETSEESAMIPSLAELAKRSASSRPLRRSKKSVPSAPADQRDPLERAASGSLSPYVLGDEEDDPLPPVDESSPYTASHPESEILAIYGGVKKRRVARAERIPVVSASLGQRLAPSAPPTPPRPWEIARRQPSSEPTPFERKGMLASSLPMPETIVLTADGRLVNASDRPRAPRGFWIGQGVGLVALGLLGVALGALAVRPEVQAFWQDLVRPGAAVSAPRAVASPEIVEEPEAEPAAEVVAAEVEVVAEPEEAQPSPPAPEVAPAAARKKEPAAPRQEPSEASAPAPAAAEVNTEAPRGDASPEAPVELGPFREDAALLALREATAHASGCRKEGDPSGMARVVVTFAPSGRVTSATISGPPFAGTETGSCVASRLRGAAIPPFSGDFVTVTKTVVIQ